MIGFPDFVINEAGIYSAIIALSLVVLAWIIKMGGPKVAAKIEKDENDSLKSIMKDVELMIQHNLKPIEKAWASQAKSIAIIETQITHIQGKIK